MTIKSALPILFLLLGGCQPPAEQAAPPPSPVPGPAAASPAPPAAPAFTGKVWMSTTSPDLPGVMRIFLADGTVVMDSCWETYRLATWRLGSDTELIMVEDGQEIHADIVNSGAEELVLRLHLIDGTTREERYSPASVPYLCPDMKR